MDEGVEHTELFSNPLSLLQVEEQQFYPSVTYPRYSPMLPPFRCRQLQEDRRRRAELQDLHDVLDIPQTHLEE